MRFTDCRVVCLQSLFFQAEVGIRDIGVTGVQTCALPIFTDEGVDVVHGPGGRRFLTVEPAALTQLTAEAMHDIAHYLRPAHLAQLRAIIDDPKASPNDRYVALDLLRKIGRAHV